MYLVAKTIFDNKCVYTVKDFEDAQKNISGKLKIKFKGFKYHENSMKVLLVSGIVFHPNFGRIQVEWNYEGRAFIYNESFPEFDLPVKRLHTNV